jgi:hypothetical protein
MQVRIKGQDQTFTLLTIVADTVETGETTGLMGKEKVTQVRAVAYVYDKERIMKKFLADDIERVEK